jgi:hypothetical protein
MKKRVFAHRINYLPDTKPPDFLSGLAQNKLLGFGSLKPQLMKVYGR